MTTPDQGPPARKELTGAGLLGLGVANATCLVLGLVLGRFLDSRFDTAPVFVLAGIALGIVVGVTGSFLEMRRYLHD